MKAAVRVGILGAGGFTGQELIRIFGHHAHVELAYITSSEYVNKPLREVFPNLVSERTGNISFSAHPVQIQDVPSLDVVFLATPDDVSLRWAGQFADAAVRVVDISGAFRLQDTAVFSEYYGLNHDQPECLKQAVYGLTEINREKIRSAKLVANPGCYPTAALLSLYAYRELIDYSVPLIIDAKSGTSGAGGRKEKDGLGYSTVYENFRTYKTAKHQHAPEIAQALASWAGSVVPLRFTPHLLPMYRGILSVAYARAKQGTTAESLVRAAEKVSAEELFLRYRPNTDVVELKAVQHTNFCDFSHYFDEKNGIIQIVSAIDNLMKGAAGQAVQNMNLMFALPETAGIY